MTSIYCMIPKIENRFVKIKSNNSYGIVVFESWYSKCGLFNLEKKISVISLEEKDSFSTYFLSSGDIVYCEDILESTNYKLLAKLSLPKNYYDKLGLL